MQMLFFPLIHYHVSVCDRMQFSIVFQKETRLSALNKIKYIFRYWCKKCKNQVRNINWIVKSWKHLCSWHGGLHCRWGPPAAWCLSFYLNVWYLAVMQICFVKLWKLNLMILYCFFHVTTGVIKKFKYIKKGRVNFPQNNLISETF